MVKNELINYMSYVRRDDNLLPVNSYDLFDYKAILLSIDFNKEDYYLNRFGFYQKNKLYDELMLLPNINFHIKLNALDIDIINKDNIIIDEFHVNFNMLNNYNNEALKKIIDASSYVMYSAANEQDLQGFFRYVEIYNIQLPNIIVISQYDFNIEQTCDKLSIPFGYICEDLNKLTTPQTIDEEYNFFEKAQKYRERIQQVHDIINEKFYIYDECILITNYQLANCFNFENKIIIDKDLPMINFNDISDEYAKLNNRYVHFFIPQEMLVRSMDNMLNNIDLMGNLFKNIILY